MRRIVSKAGHRVAFLALPRGSAKKGTNVPRTPKCFAYGIRTAKPFWSAAVPRRFGIALILAVFMSGCDDWATVAESPKEPNNDWAGGSVIHFKTNSSGSGAIRERFSDAIVWTGSGLKLVTGIDDHLSCVESDTIPLTGTLVLTGSGVLKCSSQYDDPPGSPNLIIRSPQP